MIELVVRLVFSLAVVIGMLLLLARFTSKRFRGSAGSLVQVVHRQPLSRGSSVAVVTVGSRVLVLGTTEQQVQLLTELDPEDLSLESAPALASSEPSARADVSHDVPAVAARTSSGPFAGAAAPHDVRDGVLAGSVLSMQTWRQAWAAATQRDRAAS